MNDNPIILFIKIIFEFWHNLLEGDLILELLLLAISLRLIVIPFTFFIKKITKLNELRKSVSINKISEIKRCYKGTTRNYYLKTLYRQNSISVFYNSLHSLIPFIQLPLMIAVFYFLKEQSHNYEFISLFDIKLNHPDKLLSFAGTYLNLFPLLMTFISIVSAYVYAADDSEARKPLIYSALIFFVLLYKIESIIVIYWTISNFITLIENVIKKHNWVLLKIKSFELRTLKLNRSVATNVIIISILYSMLFLIFSPFESSDSYLYAKMTIAVGIFTLLVAYLFKSARYEISVIFWPIVAIIPIFVYAPKNIMFLLNGGSVEYFGTLAIAPLLVGIFILKKLKKYKFLSQIFFMTLFVFNLMPAWHSKIKLNIEYSFFYQLLLIIIITTTFHYLKKYSKLINYISLALILFLSTEIVIKMLKNTNEINNIANQVKVPNFLKNKSVKSKPNIYIFIYDAYVGPKVMANYGIDNSSQYQYLDQLDFKLYNDKVSTGNSSISSMSQFLSLERKPLIKPRAHFGGFNTLDFYLKEQGYSRRYFTHEYFRRGFENIYHSEIIALGESEKQINILLRSVLNGEFKFDTTSAKDHYKKWMQTKPSFIAEGLSPKFVYSHSKMPGHSQNSGSCLPNEKELYAEKLLKANKEMKSDLEYVLKNDPNSIIVVMGDHAGYIKGDCVGYLTSKDQFIKPENFTDVYGVFIAIKWPDQDFEDYDNFHYLQGVPFSILSYLIKDPSILDHQNKNKICINNLCVNHLEEIITGKHKGKLIFDSL